MRSGMFMPPRATRMRLFIKDDQAGQALREAAEVVPEAGDRSGILIDIETLVVVIHNDRAELAIRLLSPDGALSNLYLLAAEIDQESAQHARNWTLQCETAVTTTAPDIKAEAEEAMREIYDLLLGKIRSCLVYERPRLALVR